MRVSEAQRIELRRIDRGEQTARWHEKRTRRSLEKRGLIECTHEAWYAFAGGEGRIRCYTLTSTGRKALESSDV
jgi:hypothetical protein